MRLYRHWNALLIGLCVSSGVFAASPVVLLEVGSVKVTDQDVRAELTRAPEETRKRVLSNPETVKQITKTLAARRLLVQEAEKSGLAATTEVQAQVRLTTDRAISDARLDQIDAANMPNAKAIDDYARAQYKANPKAFDVPAEAHVRHILLRGDDAQAKAKAEKLLAELKAGADFEKLAKENSDDRSRDKGGDLGFGPSGRFVPEFDKAVEGLKKNGEISGLVKTQFGWHIIQLVERRPARTLPYEEVADKLKTDATAKILNEKRQEKTAGLIKDVTFHEDAIKALGAAASK